MGLGEPFFFLALANKKGLGRGGNKATAYHTNIAPLASAAEDEFTLFLPAASLRSTDDTFETIPSTLSWTPYGYPSKTSSIILNLSCSLALTVS